MNLFRLCKQCVGVRVKLWPSFSLIPIVVSCFVLRNTISPFDSFLPKRMATFASAASKTLPSNPSNGDADLGHCDEVTYVDADLAKAIDDRLMSQPGYSIDQLMELAGYSVACAAHDMLHSKPSSNTGTVYILCGPGNNGGDGLVAARHLKHFGFNPIVVYPKQSSGAIFTNLVHQLDGLRIPVVKTLPDLQDASLIIDGLFGFSFKGPSREPFTFMIASMQSLQESISILSIDVPSGWDVNLGDVHGTGFEPSATISLTLPKKCMKSYRGIHYVGGRFMPPFLAEELQLRMPNYGDSVTQVPVP